jgi:thiol-disulfide isomerase/thioredoxin
MRRFPVSGSGLIGILLAAASLASAATAAGSRKAAPDFALRDSRGNAVRLSSYQGRVVLLNFWATWCHGCLLEIPWFIDFQKKYSRSGLAVVGVSMDEDGWKAVEPYLREHAGVNYPIVLGGQDLAKGYALESLPLTLLIDREGRIVTRHAGMVDRAGCEREIRELLGERAK